VCIAKTDPAFLDRLFKKWPAFEIGPFQFRLSTEQEYVNFPDYADYDITHEGVTLPFHITFVDVFMHCGSRFSINLAEFIWGNVCIFTFRMNGIVCVPLNTPTDFCLHHHSAASDGWTSDSLCDKCLEEFRLVLQLFVGNCINTCSCRCNLCLRQPPSLRNLASHSVFQLTFNLAHFTLTSRTLYHQYLYAVESDFVPDDSLIPFTFPKLQCTFVRDKLCDIRKRFHTDCVIPSERYSSTFYKNTVLTKKRIW